jgi:VIT1/CCC1 family predicted Fe2+/Mn2+ transporter
MESKTDEIVEQRVVREVAGVVRTPEVLEKVVDALELAGFDRADIDVMADVETIRKRFGTVFVPLEEFADVRGAPRRALVPRDDISSGLSTAFGVLFSIGSAVATLGVVASGGGLAAALAAAAAAGTASGGLGALAARYLGKERAKLIETMIMEGGLVVWVRVRSEERERLAEAIMRDGGAEAVRVHEIALDKRLSELPLADVVADEVGGRA